MSITKREGFPSLLSSLPTRYGKSAFLSRGTNSMRGE